MTSPTCISGFPPELLIRIADDLPGLTDVLDLRLAHTGFTAAGAESLCNRCGCTYLHRSPAALTRFEAICNNRVFRKKITKLVLLGPSEHHFRRDSFPKHPYSHLLNRPWPHFYSTSRTPAKTQPNFTQIYAEADTPFKEAYEPLSKAIDQLPQLFEMCYDSSCREVSFNPVLQTTSQSWAQANQDPAARLEGKVNRQPSTRNGRSSCRMQRPSHSWPLAGDAA